VGDISRVLLLCRAGLLLFLLLHHITGVVFLPADDDPIIIIIMSAASDTSDEVKAAPGVAVDALNNSSPKVAATRKGNVVLVPQPSDDPEDPLVWSPCISE
jgi:hypothetical protein